ncbi:MAG: hypothetical protein WC699_02875 [Bacteroidales bacterium]|jgi:hypothetical protein
MKHDADWEWDLIEQDPVLRIELSEIEQKVITDDMVAELIEFFSKVDFLTSLAALIEEEEFETLRL